MPGVSAAGLVCFALDGAHVGNISGSKLLCATTAFSDLQLFVFDQDSQRNLYDNSCEYLVRSNSPYIRITYSCLHEGFQHQIARKFAMHPQTNKITTQHSFSPIGSVIDVRSPPQPHTLAPG